VALIPFLAHLLSFSRSLSRLLAFPVCVALAKALVGAPIRLPPTNMAQGHLSLAHAAVLASNPGTESDELLSAQHSALPSLTILLYLL
jgi:hypothetical protein